MFKAYFAEGHNIALPEVLVAAAETAGLDAGLAEGVLESGEFGPAVDADWQRSRSRGVTAVPTFVANNQGLVGAQPFEALERLALTAGAQRREE